MQCLRRPIAYVLSSLVSVACSSQVRGPQPDCDVLFAGGRIVDGSGAPAFLGDVCVRGDRIANAQRRERRARRRSSARSGVRGVRGAPCERALRPVQRCAQVHLSDPKPAKMSLTVDGKT